VTGAASGFSRSLGTALTEDAAGVVVSEPDANSFDAPADLVIARSGLFGIDFSLPSGLNRLLWRLMPLLVLATTFGPGTRPCRMRWIRGFLIVLIAVVS